MGRRSILTVGGLALGVGLWAGCGGSDVPVLQNQGQNLGAIDAGTGKCGAAACASGQLCCESADTTCAPTCMNVTSCPAYGRPCQVEPPKTDAGDAGETGLSWFATCGDPICKDPPADAGPTVSCPAKGSACTTRGQTCGDPAQNCGSVLVCDDKAQGGGPGGCPISTKKYKDDVAYVGTDELQRLHDETLRMRLATYRYKGPFIDPKDPNAKHLGFIIEDQPQSLSVDRGHDRVDLYGYMSMAVATMQVQERELAALKREVAEMKTTCPAKR